MKSTDGHNHDGLYHGGAYRRDVDGQWVYAATGTRVPGSRDIRLADVIPHHLVGPPVHGQMWVSRPIALATEAFRAVLEEMPDSMLSFNLPTAVAELPDTTAIIMVPHSVWTKHENDVVAMDAPELHPAALMTLEAVAKAAGLSAPSLTEYIRRGACPSPQVQLGRTPLWSRPIVSHWLRTRSRHQVQVSCGGCGKRTEIEGLMVNRASGDIGLFPLCIACQDRLVRKLSAHPVSGPLTVEIVTNLLQVPRFAGAS